MLCTGVGFEPTFSILNRFKYCPSLQSSLQSHHHHNKEFTFYTYFFGTCTGSCGFILLCCFWWFLTWFNLGLRFWIYCWWWWCAALCMIQTNHSWLYCYSFILRDFFFENADYTGKARNSSLAVGLYVPDSNKRSFLRIWLYF